ncbi:MAG: PilZ domain-containing protein [Gammaproteobacteria bacterium]|jgi:hypothetical protein
MEHRLDDRIHAQFDVTIHTDNGDVLKARANNLSRGGVCVETEGLREIQENRLVLLEFAEDGLRAKIPALVLQTTGRSASLMFIEHSAELHSFLIQWNR